MYGADVVTIDPTPRAVTHVEREIRGRRNMRLLRVGLWNEDATVRFYAPRDPTHVSHSIVNLQRTDSYFEARCLRVSSVMRQLGHQRVTILKLDIEGAQFAVLEDVLAQGLMIDVICVEFDQPSSIASSLRMLRAMRRAGYATVNLDGLNFTFVRVPEG
jgi:FkbM family methyltransferase